MAKTPSTNPHQIIIYTTDDGKAHVSLHLSNGTAWLTQKQIAHLFDVGVAAVSKHLKNIYEDGELTREATLSKMENVGLEQGRSVRRMVDHYNLDAILAVGYRVRGPRGAQFRKWASEVLKEYLIKGFALDDKRLKNDGADTYFDELLERIRDIRTSERQFFRKICDVIAATSADYEETKTFDDVRNFFASIQNRLHFATHGHTAAEIIWERADHTKPHAGLTSWAGHRPHRGDMGIAKNFLTHDELKRMNRLTSMYLDYAEDQAEIKKTILLKDWMGKTDKWLVFNDREVLHGFGQRQHKQAIKKARSEWDSYQHRLDQQINKVDMRALEAEIKHLQQPTQQEKTPPRHDPNN